MSISTGRRIVLNKKGNTVFFVLVLAVVASFALTGALSAWIAENNDDEVTGTVNGVSWTGTAQVGWETAPNGLAYGGAALTTADSTIDELYVVTKGRELCGPIQLDVAWHNDNSVFD